jgi:DNA-binding transcriptional LysR family regulator
MNLQRLRHFVAVAETRSFAHAATRLGMKQPPLSQSIQRLERDLGVRLFRRSTRKVELTPAGVALLPEATAALAAAERGMALARAAQAGQPIVRLGVVSLALFESYPNMVRAAADAGIAIQLAYSSTNEQVRELLSGALDLGLLSPPFDAPSRMFVTEIARERAVVALPAALAGTNEESVSLRHISDRLILFPRPEGPHLYDMTLAMFERAGLHPKIVEETPASMLATLALVGAGRGFALVPASIMRHVSVRGVVYKPIEAGAAAPTWPLALAHMPLGARSPAARLLGAWRRMGGAKQDRR